MSDDGSKELPSFEYVPDPIPVTLLVPMPQQGGGIRYRKATENDLADVLLSLDEEGRQRVGHLMQAKLQKDKTA